MDNKLQVAVVGGGGVVGKEILSALLERGFPADQLTILGSERSEGSEVEYGEESLEIEKATPESFRGISVALFATPAEVSEKLAPAAQAAGAWVVDASSAFRGNRDVPLAFPLFKGQSFTPQRGRIVRIPSALSTALVLSLEPLRQRFGILQVEGTALMCVSASGERGVGELEKQTTSLLSGRDPDPSFFPYRVGFNLIPQVGTMTEKGWTEEELWAIDDTRQLWGEGSRGVAVSLTAIQVPIFYGHALSLAVRLRSAVSAEAVRDALRGVEALKLLDDPTQKIYPLTMTVTADDSVHVGRIRSVPEAPDWIRMYAVIDNAGRGAALNALEAAEVLLGTELGDPDEQDEDEDDDTDDLDDTSEGEESAPAAPAEEAAPPSEDDEEDEADPEAEDDDEEDLEAPESDEDDHGGPKN